MNKKITVIINLCYKKLINKNIQTLIKQTMDQKYIEILCFGNIDKDEFFSLLEQKEGHIKYYLTEGGTPVGTIYNKGLELSETPYIIFYDQTYIFDITALHKLWFFIQNYKQDITCSILNKETLIRKFSIHGNLFSTSFLKEKNIRFNENFSFIFGEDFYNQCLLSGAKIFLLEESIIYPDIFENKDIQDKDIQEIINMYKKNKDFLLQYNKEEYKSPYDFLYYIFFYYNTSYISHFQKEEILSFLLDFDDKDYKESLRLNTYRDKPNLLIVGHLLNFIKPLLPYLKQDFNLFIIEREGFEHFLSQTEKEEILSLLPTMDILFAEWLIDDAVFLSKHKKPNQKLFIRYHLMERNTDFGNLLHIENVDKIISVNPYYLYEIVNKFNFPMEKVAYIPNFIDTSLFNKEKDSNSLFHILMAGYSPSRKRIDKAINIITQLQKKDKRFRLHITGKPPLNHPFIKNKESEVAFYKKNIIKKNYIIYHNYVFMPNFLKQIGFILSVSDYESFHMSLAEGMASGSAGISINWTSAENIYYPEMIFSNTEDMAQKIWDLTQNPEDFKNYTNKAKSFIYENYDIETIYLKYKKLFLGSIR